MVPEFCAKYDIMAVIGQSHAVYSMYMHILFKYLLNLYTDIYIYINISASYNNFSLHYICIWCFLFKASSFPIMMLYSFYWVISGNIYFSIKKERMRFLSCVGTSRYFEKKLSVRHYWNSDVNTPLTHSFHNLNNGSFLYSINEWAIHFVIV